MSCRSPDRWMVGRDTSEISDAAWTVIAPLLAGRRRLHHRLRPSANRRQRGLDEGGLGLFRGGLTTKIHLACDGRGGPGIPGHRRYPQRLHPGRSRHIPDRHHWTRARATAGAAGASRGRQPAIRPPRLCPPRTRAAGDRLAGRHSCVADRRRVDSGPGRCSRTPCMSRFTERANALLGVTFTVTHPRKGGAQNLP